jgi:hypothetical protein
VTLSPDLPGERDTGLEPATFGLGMRGFSHGTPSKEGVSSSPFHDRSQNEDPLAALAAMVDEAERAGDEERSDTLRAALRKLRAAATGPGNVVDLSSRRARRE